MTLYERFRELDIDFSQLGLERDDARGGYFCTPVGAQIIGWAGVDGIHCCFVEGFGETVFAVDPSALPGDHVHPLARSFEDFLRLLLACNGLAAAEQARLWDREGFDAFLAEDGPPDPRRQAALDGLRDALGLAPMDDPYGYIRQVQAGFDTGRIPCREDWRDCVPEGPRTPERPAWKVYFAGGFGHHHVGRDKPGREIPVGKRFTWGGKVWHVPAVYVCGKGLVVDLCLEIDPAGLRAFRDRWMPRSEEGAPLTPEEEDRRTAEDPMAADYEPKLTVNGRQMLRRSGNGFGWVPASCRPEGQRGRPGAPDWEAIWLMDHYGLDPRRGWMFCRDSFPWAAKTRAAVKALSLSLAARPVPVPGPRFTVSGAGDTVPFTHPVTGQAHTLRVVEHEARGMNAVRLRGRGRWEYPAHYTAMSFVTQPELPRGSLTVRDCGKGDPPRIRRPDPSRPKAACGVGIVAGGADGPAAILLANGKTAQPHAACSSLYFEPPEQIEWRMVFYQKTAEDIEVELPLPQD